MGLDISIYRIVDGTVKDFYKKVDEKMNYYKKEEEVLKKVYENLFKDNKEKINELINELKKKLNDNLNEERLIQKILNLVFECEEFGCDDKEMIKWNIFNYFGILKNIFDDIAEDEKDEIVEKIIETVKNLVIREEDKKALSELEKEEKKIGDYSDMLEELAYFRKYNHLVAWVNKNVQKVKNCSYITLTREQLQQLLEDAKKALQAYKEGNFDKIKKLMPNASGFFFGDTEYNDYYKRKLEDTIEQIKRILNNYSDKEFIFQADW